MVGVAVTAHTGDEKLSNTPIVWKRQELCKNIEGDPAKPGLAATTCWRHGIELCGRLHSLGARKRC